MSKTGSHPMERLKERLSLITASIPKGSEVIYIDYPVHSNGGDILIMKGTEEFFKAHGIRVKARYSVLDFPDDLRIPRAAFSFCTEEGTSAICTPSISCCERASSSAIRGTGS